MQIASSIVTAARRNGNNEIARRSAPAWERFTQVDAVVDLLADSTSPAAQPAARSLLRQMAEQSWDVIRGLHRSQLDPTPHVTVRVKGIRYHLRLDARECVFDITLVAHDKRERLACRLPWVGAGA